MHTIHKSRLGNKAGRASPLVVQAASPIESMKELVPPVLNTWKERVQIYVENMINIIPRPNPTELL